VNAAQPRALNGPRPWSRLLPKWRMAFDRRPTFNFIGITIIMLSMALIAYIVFFY
jgi:hypothetical protein